MLKTFFIFCRQRILNIFDKDSVTTKFCESCIHFKKSCHISNKFKKYIKYIKTSRPCNLIFLNIRKYKKLNAKHKILKKTLRQLHEKSSKILCELNEIEKKQQKMINIGWPSDRIGSSFFLPIRQKIKMNPIRSDKKF